MASVVKRRAVLEPSKLNRDSQKAGTTMVRVVLSALVYAGKNHSFFDGNKRIAATLFLYFLDKNEVLFIDGQKKIEDAALVALTIMIAESRPEEKEMMISVIMNCML